MKFHILTLFPEMVLNGLNTSIIGRAAEQGLIELNAVNIRDYTQDKHGKVDDYPYGGGAGMLMQAQPVYDAYRAVAGERRVRTVYVTPQGQPFTQHMAEEFAGEEELVFLCGHYEGIDERVLEEIVTDYVSIGDYVLTGGELPAMVMIDAISRLVPGVLNNEVSAETESFHNDLLEYPQYSRPESWHDKRVPEVLLSGNHRNIMKWRLEQSERRTAERRPDLYRRYQEKCRLIKKLSGKKRENIHIMELLSRGFGEICIKENENLLVIDRKSQICFLQASSGEAFEKLLTKVPEEAKLLAVNQWLPESEVREQLKLDLMLECVQYCYSRKETLPVKHKDIRRLDESFLPYLAAHYGDGEEEYLKERLVAGMMYGAFLEDRIVGFIGLHEEGSMGFLFVEEAHRRKGLAASLEAYLINKQLEWGWTPYAHIRTENEASLRLQEKLGLYASAGRILWLIRR